MRCLEWYCAVLEGDCREAPANRVRVPHPTCEVRFKLRIFGGFHAQGRAYDMLTPTFYVIYLTI